MNEHENSQSPSRHNWLHDIGVVLLVLGVVALVFFSFLTISLIIAGFIFLWLAQGALGGATHRRARRIIVVACVAAIILFAAFFVYEQSYQSYVNEQLYANYQPHLPYMGEAQTYGYVMSAHSYTIPGFLGIGHQVKEDIVVFVPSTRANFSQSFLCDYFHVGQNVTVDVTAYNSTYAGDKTYFPFPANFSSVPTLATSQVTNSSYDVTTTFVYGARTVTMDVIGRDYQIVSAIPNSCLG